MYKKYIEGTTPTNNSSQILVEGINSIVNDCIYIKRKNSEQWHRANYGMVNTNEIHVSPIYLATGSMISIYIENTNFQGQPFKGYIEYTKN